MREAIRRVREVGTCSICGDTNGVKAFQINEEDPDFPTIALCPTHGREIIDELSTAFPEESPIFVKAMQKL